MLSRERLGADALGADACDPYLIDCERLYCLTDSVNIWKDDTVVIDQRSYVTRNQSFRVFPVFEAVLLCGEEVAPQLNQIGH